MIWVMCRTFLGDYTLHVSPGRYEYLRETWAIKVRNVLDDIESTSRAAMIVAYYDGKKSVELLERIESLKNYGYIDSTKQHGLSSKEESIAEWGRMHGGSWDDPAIRDKVYKAVEMERKLEIEANEKRALANIKAKAASTKLRKRGRG